MLEQSLSAEHSVCVVIPMYNGADSIEQTLASLVGQTRLPEHVIVVDDGSTDDGPQRVKDFLAPFRLTLVRQVNEGQASARNHALQYTGETLVAFLDADDQWHRQKLEKQITLYDELLSQGRPVGLIDCNVLIDYSDGHQQVEERYKNGMHFFDFVHCNIINGVSTVLIPREVLTRLGGFESSLRYSEDRMMWARIAEHWEIHTVPEVLMRRTVNGGNITAQPKKYYHHKVRFIEMFLSRYAAQLTEQQRIDFELGNLADFLGAFSRAGEHAEVLGVYRRMWACSWQALIFGRGKPTLRYLYAYARTLGRTATSTTAH